MLDYSSPITVSDIGTQVHPAVRRLRSLMAISIAVLFFLVVPGMNLLGAIGDDKVQTLGRYLTFALVALGLDLVWGYTGLLSLCQALFFCIGGYAMAMHLSLPEGGGIYDVPQFLSFVYYGHDDPLPPFWKPFRFLLAAVVAGVGVSGLLATLFGFFIFRSRVRGVYFSILTQAVAWGVWLLVCQNEMLLGGTNGLTNFNKGFTQNKSWILGLYLLTCLIVVIAYLVCHWVVQSRAGRILVAVRDKEMRLYFAGYKPHAFKVFIFALAAVLGAVGGMLYPIQFTIITPADMNVQASIFIVMMVAFGGRGKLWGAVLGAVVLNILRGALSSDLSDVWQYCYGGLFIAVVLLFPDGMQGLWTQIERAFSGELQPSKVIVPATLFGSVVCFSLVEVLGLMPGFLQTEWIPSILDRTPSLKGKYVAIAILALNALIWQWRLSRKLTTNSTTSTQAASVTL